MNTQVAPTTVPSPIGTLDVRWKEDVRVGDERESYLLPIGICTIQVTDKRIWFWEFLGAMRALLPSMAFGASNGEERSVWPIYTGFSVANHSEDARKDPSFWPETLSVTAFADRPLSLKARSDNHVFPSGGGYYLGLEPVRGLLQLLNQQEIWSTRPSPGGTHTVNLYPVFAAKAPSQLKILTPSRPMHEESVRIDFVYGFEQTLLTSVQVTLSREKLLVIPASNAEKTVATV